MVMDISLKDNDFLRQFETSVDGNLAKIEYSLKERKIFLTKLIVPETVNDDDFKTEFIKTVFTNIEERNLKIVPTSPDIAKFIRKNKQYKELLPVCIKL